MADKKINEVTPVATMGDNSYIVITLADGSLGRIKRDDLVNVIADLLPASGSHQISGLMTREGWYRIYKGRQKNDPSSALVNICNGYNYNPPAYILLYIVGSGYAWQNIQVMNKTGDVLFSKARFIYGGTANSELCYVDIYYTRSSPNSMFLSASCSLSYKPLMLEAVTEELPEGYASIEFTL